MKYRTSTSGGVSVHRQPVRQKPALDAFVDAVERREHVAHVETKQDVARVDLVDEQQAAGPEDAQQLGERAPLLLDRREMVQHVDDVDEVVRRHRRPGCCSTDPTRITSPARRRCGSASATWPADASMPSTSNPSSRMRADVRALAAPDVEAPPPGRPHALEHVAHQLRLASRAARRAATRESARRRRRRSRRSAPHPPQRGGPHVHAAGTPRRAPSRRRPSPAGCRTRQTAAAAPARPVACSASSSRAPATSTPPGASTRPPSARGRGVGVLGLRQCERPLPARSRASQNPSPGQRSTPPGSWRSPRARSAIGQPDALERLALVEQMCRRNAPAIPRPARQRPRRTGGTARQQATSASSDRRSRPLTPPEQNAPATPAMMPSATKSSSRSHRLTTRWSWRPARRRARGEPPRERRSPRAGTARAAGSARRSSRCRRRESECASRRAGAGRSSAGCAAPGWRR